MPFKGGGKKSSLVLNKLLESVVRLHENVVLATDVKIL